MTSSKKQRGKQRKAAKLAAAANNNISGDDTTPAVGGDVGSEISGGHRTTEAFSDDLHLLWMIVLILLIVFERVMVLPLKYYVMRSLPTVQKQQPLEYQKVMVLICGVRSKWGIQRCPTSCARFFEA